MIRLATIDDLNLVFQWRNSPEIVKDGTLQQGVTLEEHTKWFQDTVLGTKRRLWIVEPDAGTVRVDNNGWCGVVSIYLLPEFQGKGLGTKSLDEACRQAFEHWPKMRELWAYIRHDNLRSMFAFGAVGFVESSTTNCPTDHIVMVRTRG